MIMGQMLEMKITHTAAGCAASTPSRPRGSHASGDTGRSNEMMGAVKPLKKAKRPIMKPSGMPISAAIPKPMPTRCNECRIDPTDALVVGSVVVEGMTEQFDRGDPRCI